MPSNYAPLAAFLAAQPPDTTAVTLTFGEITALMGGAVPRRMATKQFWTNAQRGTVSVWHAAGWQVTRTTMRAAVPTITFTRMPRREGTPQASSQRRVNLAEASEMPRRPLDEALHEAAHPVNLVNPSTESTQSSEAVNYTTGDGSSGSPAAMMRIVDRGPDAAGPPFRRESSSSTSGRPLSRPAAIN